MGKWNFKVNVKALLSEYAGKTDVESLKELGAEIALLMKRPLKKFIDSASDDWDPLFEEVYDRFSDGDFDNVEEFDALLSDMYDQFNAHRVWAGL